ncbi:hypothetical protein M0R04_09445 [Candidatus Dojkabacteria bacterium]|nr:hypothetical protein [Candidatus Dojkabacteria bacterium]
MDVATPESVVAIPQIFNEIDDSANLSASFVAPLPEKSDKPDPKHNDERKPPVSLSEVFVPKSEEAPASKVEDDVINLDEPIVEVTPKEEAPPKPKDAVQKRIDEITKKYRVTERELEQAKQREQELASKLKELEARVPVEGKPASENFETEEEYLEALTDWKVEQKFKAAELKLAETSKPDKDKLAIEQAEKPYAELDEKLKVGYEKYTDFEEVVLNEKLKLTDAMVDATLELQTPHEVLYYLGKHPEESKKISEMSIPRMAASLAKIDLVLNAPKPAKKVSQAPEPISPVESNGIITKDPSTMPFKEYVKWRQAGN